jgi:hypothetical protein
MALAEAAETIQGRDFLPLPNGRRIQLQRPIAEVRQQLMNKAIEAFCAAIVANGGFVGDWTDRCTLRAESDDEAAIDDLLASVANCPAPTDEERALLDRAADRLDSPDW